MPGTKPNGEAVFIPKWLWGVLVGASIAAAHHSVMLHVTASEVKALQAGHLQHSELLMAIQTAQTQHSAVIGTLGSLKNQCVTMNTTLQQVRDDVIVLKTRDHHALPGVLSVE
jgi:hypothetical protein